MTPQNHPRQKQGRPCACSCRRVVPATHCALPPAPDNALWPPGIKIHPGLCGHQPWACREHWETPALKPSLGRVHIQPQPCPTVQPQGLICAPGMGATCSGPSARLPGTAVTRWDGTVTATGKIKPGPRCPRSRGTTRKKNSPVGTGSQCLH